MITSLLDLMVFMFIWFACSNIYIHKICIIKMVLMLIGDL